MSGTKVTDAGLLHLRELQNLDSLIVYKTPMTLQGLAAFHKALPSCKINHDGGVIGTQK